jgi:L-alanine-DL-glutamate epimerase-like enolase superfamily enzyme
MQVELRRVDWPYKTPFRISYQVSTVADTVQIELKDGGLVGRGEASGVSYHGETADSLLDELTALRQDLINGISRAELQKRLPPGGARNAIDCALWDLEAKRAGKRVWELAGIPTVKPITTDFTLGIETPEVMAKAAAAAKNCPALKIKLGGGAEDIARIEAIRAARPDAQIIVDANQGWDEKQLHEIVPVLARLDVRLIEQPMPVGKDEALRNFKSPIPLCADESCQTRESLPALVGKYGYINIKLDKTGGLTEGLELARAAMAQGFKLMVGCMGGSSLSMAPHFVVGQFCDFVDLDGPLLATSDVPNAIRYDGGHMPAPDAALWG